jgi:hypothetical protein
MQACCVGAGQDLLTSPTSSHVPPRPPSPPHEANASVIPSTSLTTFAARRLSRRRHIDRNRGRSFPIIRVPRAPHDAAAIRLSRRRHLDRVRGRAFPIIRVRPPRARNAVPPPVNPPPLLRDLALLDTFCEAPTCICSSCNRRMYRYQGVRPRVESEVRTLLKLNAIMSMSCI